jgi:alkylation response protein AidB-like acyl-CoA dehydrogenase
MTSLIPRAELDFLLHDWLAIGPLLERSDHARETIDGLLDLSERLATEHFLPHYKDADIHEPRLDAEGVHVLPAIAGALRHYAELGLFSAGFAPELGGLGLPYLACMASFAQFAAANISIAAYPMLTTANARLIATFGNAAQTEAFALPQIEGRWFGTMCLSEPQAGSSLADIATRAEPDGEDGFGARYRLTGNKMWISGGDQDVSENIIHLVLAKVPGADGRLIEGTRGISLFIVPKRLPDGTRNDVTVAGLNHKMGYRGIPNCLLNLGERGGATGWLVGNAGDGLRQMFLMMNEARIGVGLGAAALGYRGYRLALAYAQDRTQGRPDGRRDGPPAPIISHPDVRHMLLAQKTYVEGALALCLYCARLVDEAEEDAGAAALLGLLTPVAKTWPSEYGLAANDLAIQIHGGYGYTRDFDVEQLYRDNRLNPIHEGTTGIQAMDLLGRKILRDDGSSLAALRAAMKATRAKATTPELAALADALDAAWAKIEEAIEAVRDAQPARALDNATAFLRAFGHAVVGWLWLDIAVTAQQADGLDPAFRAAKLHAARYFFASEMPKVGAWLETVAGLNDLAATATF